MKTSRFNEPQILAILCQAEGGVPVPRALPGTWNEHATFYKWCPKYGGMDASMISRMKALDDEKRRLKKMYAEMSMQAELLKEALGKNDVAVSTPGALRQMKAFAYRSRDAGKAVALFGVGIALACRTFEVSDLLSLQRQAERRERADRQSPHRVTRAKNSWGWP